MVDLPPLKDVVAALPELYQPVYGHPEFSASSSRSDDSRLGQIMAVHNALTARLQRPLRVLDLGCAQGWFGFNLANAGAQVLGIDYLVENINLCNMLVLENRHLQIRFKLMEIEKIMEFLVDDQFDLVLGFSVFHHLCNHNGKEATRKLLGRIYAKIPSCLLELALASEEGMGWAGALPDNPDYLIDQMPFYRVLSRHATHLTPVARPLYFGSSQFWYLNGDIGRFSEWHDSGCGRRYFVDGDRFIKLYQTTGEWGETNHFAIVRSAHFLKNPPDKYTFTPKHFDNGEAYGFAWLVQERIKGTMLHDMMHQGVAYNEREILCNVLRQLAALERAGLYHTDIRVWNILVDDAGFPLLIDYDAIDAEKRDCAWPYSIFLSFFIFINEVVTHRQLGNEMGRAPFISPFNLPEPYRQWGLRLWNRPVDAWNFAYLLETLEGLPMTQDAAAKAESANALWMKHMEEMVNDINNTIQSMSGMLHKLNDIVVADHKVLLHRLPQDKEDAGV